jgi:photosynthetic reaction center cytochrome c subunit
MKRVKVIFAAAAAMMIVSLVVVGAGETVPARVIQSRTTVLNVLSVRAMELQTDKVAAPPRRLMAEEVFKNIQALKGVPVDDFMATMGLMAAALGFDCDSCHERAGTDKVAWEKDTPTKRTARRMVFMVQAINRENFGGRQMVTCFTCHRNRYVPLVTPNLDDWYGQPTQAFDDVLITMPGGATVDQIFDKYLQAIGGAQRVATLTSFIATGKGSSFGGFGGDARVEIVAQAPDKRATFISYPEYPDRGGSIRTFDGRIGWLATPLAVLRKYELSGSELDGAKVDAELSFPSRMKSEFTNLRVGPTMLLKDKVVQLVQGTGPREMLVTFYFDQISGLLVRVVRYGSSPIGRLPTQIDYEDYRDVGGIKFPFRLTFSWLDGRDSFEMTNIQLNVPIDSTRFGEPSPMESAK